MENTSEMIDKKVSHHPKIIFKVDDLARETLAIERLYNLAEKYNLKFALGLMRLKFLWSYPSSEMYFSL